MILSWIQVNNLFKNYDKRKRRQCDRIIHKAVIIHDDIYQRKYKFSDTVQPESLCRLEL